MKIEVTGVNDSEATTTVVINSRHTIEVSKEFWDKRNLEDGMAIDPKSNLWDEFVGSIRSTLYPNRIGPGGSVGHVNVSGDEVLNDPDLSKFRDDNLFTRKERESAEYVLNN